MSRLALPWWPAQCDQACSAQTIWLKHLVQVTLDINHELAGQTLNFEVELMALTKVLDSSSCLGYRRTLVYAWSCFCVLHPRMAH